MRGENNNQEVAGMPAKYGTNEMNVNLTSKRIQKVCFQVFFLAPLLWVHSFFL